MTSRKRASTRGPESHHHPHLGGPALRSIAAGAIVRVPTSPRPKRSQLLGSFGPVACALLLVFGGGGWMTAHPQVQKDVSVPFCAPPHCGWVPANVPIGIVETQPSLNGIAYVSPSSLAVVGFGGTILRSGDAGRNWTVVSSPLPSVTMTSLIVLTGGLLLAGGNNADMIASQNGGVSWYPYYPGGGLAGNVTEMGFTSLSFVYASTTDGLYVSHNAAETWSAMNTPEKGGVFAAGFSSPSVGWINMGTRAGVYYTQDGGAHWTRLTMGLDPLYATDIVPTGPYSAWVLQYQGYIFLVTGGTNSTEMDLSTQQRTHQVFADPPYAWVVSDDANTFYTQDNGGCWVEESVPSIPELYTVAFDNPLDGVVAGDGVIWYTTDAGVGSNDTNPCSVTGGGTPVIWYVGGGLAIAAVAAASVVYWRRYGGEKESPETKPPEEAVRRMNRKLRLRNRKRYIG